MNRFERGTVLTAINEIMASIIFYLNQYDKKVSKEVEYLFENADWIQFFKKKPKSIVYYDYDENYCDEDEDEDGMSGTISSPSPVSSVDND